MINLHNPNDVFKPTLAGYRLQGPVGPTASAQGCEMCCCSQSVGRSAASTPSPPAMLRTLVAARSGARRAGRRGHLRAARAGALVAGRVRPRLPLAPAVPPVRGGRRRGALPRRARAARLARRQRRVPVARAARRAGPPRGRRPCEASQACYQGFQSARLRVPALPPAGTPSARHCPSRWLHQVRCACEHRGRVGATARVFRMLAAPRGVPAEIAGSVQVPHGVRLPF